MTKVLSYVIAAVFAAASVSAFAMKHVGGAKDDKVEKKEMKKDDKKEKKVKKDEMKKEEKK